ncbi:MAG: hypothetical protein KIT31_26560 [Deltaproteobacteria bacterium]|nr:hypothetical protein [Deltaproteobacteria bacterium]
MLIRRWCVVGALALALPAAVGCKKDDDPVGKQGGSDSPDPKDPGAPKAYDSKPPPVAVGKLAATPAQLASSEDLSLLPVDAEVVMGINFAQIQTSEAWKQLIEPKLSGNGDFVGKLGELKATCGFDPMAEIKSLAVGMKGLGGGTRDGVIVVHGLDKGKTMACFDKKDALAKHDLDASLDGDVAFLRPAKGEPEDVVGVTFVNDTTAIVVIGPRATKEGVNKAAAGKSPLKTSPTFIDMYNRLDTTQSMWVMVNGNWKVFDRLKQLGITAAGMFGTLATNDSVGLDLRMRLDSADTAASIKGRWGSTAEGYLKNYADKVTITTEGPDVRFVVATANLDRLKSLVK